MKKQNKKKRKGFQAGSMRCPYCGSPVIYRSADGIYHDNSKGTMLYVCSHYPECDAYVRVHAGTNIPVGSLANHELRTLRRTAHQYFDQLYQSGYMSKQDAYQWLADLICAPLSEAHVPTASMEPTLPKGSYIIGLRLYTDLEKGDIIIFRHDGKLLIKRIAAVGGEYVTRNGEFLLVPEGCYYVLGDNVGNSLDSRYWEEPFVEEKEIVAKLILN